MFHGKIVAVHADRGFGFVDSADLEKEIFFHVTGLSPELLPFTEALKSRRVTFDTENGTRGLKAVNIRPED